MPRPASAPLLAALITALALSGCTGRGGVGTTTSQPDAPTQALVFDMGHGEIFGPDDTSDLGQSQAIERMRSAGFEVRVNRDTITAEDLDGVSGLVLAGPMRPLMDDEYAAINDFLVGGGTVVLTIHVPFPVMAVPAHWGLPVTPLVMLSDEPLPDARDASIFIADQVAEGALTEGVDGLLVVSGWPVAAAADNAAIAIGGSESVWVDADRDGYRSPNDGSSPGVVGSATVGKGHVIVIGDDAVFANVAIGESGNARLLDNILRMMRRTVDT